MIDKRRRVWWLPAIVLAWMAIVSSGCSEELGPEHMAVARVSGIVKEGARPVSGGWIEFYPVDGTVGNLCSARLRADGSFEAEYVAVGVNVIRLVNVPLGMKGAKQIVGRYTSPIRRTIPAHPTERVSIDVIDELIRWRAAQPAGSGPGARASGEAR